MTFVGRGYPSRLEDAEKSHDDLPTQNVITRLTAAGDDDWFHLRLSHGSAHISP